jgi:hypothetical protein
MQYTEKELTKLLADVEKEFTSHLAKAEENFRLAKSEDSTASSVDGTVLAKAEDEKSGEAKKDDKKEDKKEAPKAESKEAPSKEEAPAEEAPAAEGEEEAAPDAEQADAAADPSADGQVYDEEDLAQMRQMYSEMSFEELMAHHDAVKECLDAMSAQQAPAEAAAPEAPAPEAAVEAAPADAEPAPFAKSEGSVQAEMMKSENLALAAKNEELKKSLDAVSEFITKLVAKKAAPSAKAITAVDTIAKSETSTEVKTLSKSEITAILNRKAAEQTLSKSDRESINAYYGAGQVSIEKISHLLK